MTVMTNSPFTAAKLLTKITRDIARTCWASYRLEAVLLLNTKKKYLVRVLLNLKKVFSTSTLRGVFQKYLVRVLNTL